MILKKQSVRKCVACDNLFPKKELTRIVITNENNIIIDLKQKLNGRGAYLCNNQECKRLLFKRKMLNRAFKVNLSEDIYNKLEMEFDGLND